MTKCEAEWVCRADQNGNNLRIIGAYLQISDYCSVTVRVRAGLGLGLVRVRIKVSIRVRVADCCIQTAGEIDKMRICHVIKTDQLQSDPQIHSAFCLVPYLLPPVTRSGTSESRTQVCWCTSVALTTELLLLL